MFLIFSQVPSNETEVYVRTCLPFQYSAYSAYGMF